MSKPTAKEVFETNQALNILRNHNIEGWVFKFDCELSPGVKVSRDCVSNFKNGDVVPLFFKDGSDEHLVGTVLLKNEEEGIYGYAMIPNKDIRRDINLNHGLSGFISGNQRTIVAVNLIEEGVIEPIDKKWGIRD